MTAIVLLPYFDLWELAEFCRLSKASYHIMHTVVNYQVLFKAQGMHFTPNDVAEAKITPSKALQIAVKYIMLNSIVYSPQIMRKGEFQHATEIVNVPNLQNLFDKSMLEVRNMAIYQV